MIEEMKLVVGLGNPGRAYADNRHNVGFRCVSYFAKKYNIPIIQTLKRARVGIGDLDERKVILAKPRTYMNMSGEAVESLVAKYGIALNNLLVVYDDLALHLGKIRIRQRGRSAGHNGMRSIIASLGTQSVPRLRIGIGGEVVGAERFVLSNFSASEKEILRGVIATVSEAIYCILTEGVEIAMNRFN